MTVGDLRERMSQREFVQWSRYHAARVMQEEIQHAEAEARARRGG